MKSRYLLGVARGAIPPGTAAQIGQRTGLECVFEHPRIVAFADSACGCQPLEGQGLILGMLFLRHGRASPIESLPAREIEQILSAPASRLISTFWGGYICAVEQGGSVQLLRDPSGVLPCYFADAAPMTFFASEAGLLLTAGCSTALDWLAIGRHHFTSALPTPDTALSGVKELMPGCAIEVGTAGGDGQIMRWSPWDHVAEEKGRFANEREERLYRLVTHCVAAWSAPHERLLTSVSGGVDSSIVAAGLVRAKRSPLCLTMYTEDPAGDERAYAKALCEHLGVELRAAPYLLDHVDIDCPLNPHLPRPCGRSPGQAYERAHLDLAREIGADAFVSGIGGDNVFGYSQSAAAIADRWLAQGFTRALDTLRDVCRQTGCGPLAALRAAMRVRRRRNYRWRPTPDFLHADFRAVFGAADLSHPWLDPPVGALPGKAAHIASLLRLHHLLEPGRSDFAPVLYPLISQPIVEMCLGIPSWAWRAGGVDRAVARRAFARDLPELIVQRRVKGGPDGFSAGLMRRHRAAIRERLLEGELARRGIIDRAALELRLVGASPLQPAEQTILFDLLDTEAWARSWARRLAPDNAPATNASVPSSG